MSALGALVPVVVFTLEGLTCGFPLTAVERVHRAAEVSLLPGAPPVIRGVVNLNGTIVPVIDLRTRLGIVSRPIGPEDRFLLTRSSRLYFVTADAVAGIVEVPPWQGNNPLETLGADSPLGGITRSSDGLILIYDLDLLLSGDDEMILDEALGTFKR